MKIIYNNNYLYELKNMFIVNTYTNENTKYKSTPLLFNIIYDTKLNDNTKIESMYIYLKYWLSKDKPLMLTECFAKYQTSQYLILAIELHKNDNNITEKLISAKLINIYNKWIIKEGRNDIIKQNKEIINLKKPIKINKELLIPIESNVEKQKLLNIYNPKLDEKQINSLFNQMLKAKNENNYNQMKKIYNETKNSKNINETVEFLYVILKYLDDIKDDEQLKAIFLNNNYNNEIDILKHKYKDINDLYNKINFYNDLEQFKSKGIGTNYYNTLLNRYQNYPELIQHLQNANANLNNYQNYEIQSRSESIIQEFKQALIDNDFNKIYEFKKKYVYLTTKFNIILSQYENEKKKIDYEFEHARNYNEKKGIMLNNPNFKQYLIDKELGTILIIENLDDDYRIRTAELLPLTNNKELKTKITQKHREFLDYMNKIKLRQSMDNNETQQGYINNEYKLLDYLFKYDLDKQIEKYNYTQSPLDKLKLEIIKQQITTQEDVKYYFDTLEPNDQYDFIEELNTSKYIRDQYNPTNIARYEFFQKLFKKYIKELILPFDQFNSDRITNLKYKYSKFEDELYSDIDQKGIDYNMNDFNKWYEKNINYHVFN